MRNERPLRVLVNGARNEVAEFEGGLGLLEVGSMDIDPDLGEESVLLTATGQDERGRSFDIEIAVALSDIPELLRQIQDRAKR